MSSEQKVTRLLHVESVVLEYLAGKDNVFSFSELVHNLLVILELQVVFANWNMVGAATALVLHWICLNHCF